ncbi:AAA family ATPase [Christensenella tenuis]|jgi:MoxR-like ATPase|uniref:MoxR family ATPase n=1 Tax=Christensenella tenuis TaxID=2763033 RepID=A0ABR7EEC2_9FIRM|nr:MoxR family ATPase [Christensenella tenuis]MBC5648137.1 MoxR family ATPase [Christensenella tenuis]
MANKSKEVIAEVKKVIVGKDEVIKKVFMAILSRGHVLLDDIPGVGKTTMALSFSRALGLDYQRIQCTPDTTPSDIIGYSFYKKGSDELVYNPGAVMCNMLLADEINRTSTKTQSALLEVMEEGNVTVDGVTRPLPQPFTVIATQNPFGSAGTQLLPQSQLDRFTVCLGMGYPDYESHVSILRDRNRDQPLDQVQQVASMSDIIAMQNEVDNINVRDELFGYITDLAECTRNNKDILLGLSPRGALAVVRMAKANAYINDRDYLVPQDIVDIFYDVTAHRMVISPKTKIAGITAQDILKKILETTKTPDFGAMV